METDPTVRKLTKALVAKYIPDDGEADGEESEALCLKVVRRGVLEQILGTDDFGDFDSLTIGDIPTAKRNRLIAKLDARGLDRSGIGLSTPIADALRQLLPQIRAKVVSSGVRQSGTFTDDFEGEGSDVDLASHTPSGGTAWTRSDGLDNDALCHSAGTVSCSGSNTAGGIYLCDDQGSADHYLNFTMLGNNIVSFFACRVATYRSYIGIRPSGNLELYKRTSGSGFTKLGENTGGISDGWRGRLECSGDAHEVFLDSGSGFVSEVGPVNDAYNNTQTWQGISARNDGGNAIAYDFEAGVLGGGIVVVGAATETDTAFDVNPTKIASVGIAQEFDAAQLLADLVSVGEAQEVNSAQTVKAEKIVVVGLTQEDDTAFSLGTSVVVHVGLATENDTGFIQSIVKRVSAGQAIEIDTALSTSHVQVVAVGEAQESNTVFGVSAYKGVNVNLAQEIDTAFNLGQAVVVSVGSVQETTVAQLIVVSRYVPINQVTESSVAQPVEFGSTNLLDITAETNTAFAVDIRKVLGVAQAGETNTALSIAPRIHVNVNQSLESNTVFALALSKHAGVGTAQEFNTALTLVSQGVDPSPLRTSYAIDESRTSYAIDESRTSYAIQ